MYIRVVNAYVAAAVHCRKSVHAAAEQVNGIKADIRAVIEAQHVAHAASVLGMAELHIFYEDENILVYYLRQNPRNLYELATMDPSVMVPPEDYADPIWPETYQRYMDHEDEEDEEGEESGEPEKES